MHGKRLALLTICLGFFMVILDTTIVNAALPAIAKGLHPTTAGLEWIVAGYTLSFVSLLLLAGSLVDRIGSKKNLYIGFTAFLLTSLGCGLAPDTHALIIFRILQGASSAALVPASIASLHHLFTNPKDRAKAIGIWGSTGGIAAAAGPIVCSLLTAHFGWRSIFLINIPIALL